MLNFFDYLHLTMSIFLFGAWGILVIRSNVISVLISIELMLFACNFNFVVFSFHLDDLIGQLLSLFVLTVAAAESAIGLAILVVYYRISNDISIDFINRLKGLLFFIILKYIYLESI